MKVYFKPLLILFPILLLIGVFYFQKRNQNSAGVEQTTSGVSNLDIDSVLDWKNQSVALADHKGAVVVHFWASWCGPCVHEFPDLIEMVKKQNGNVKVLAVAEDKDLKEVEVFVKSFPQALMTPNFHILWDKDRSFMKRWNVEKLPESYIYDSARTMVKRVSGAVSWTNEDAQAFFKKLTETKP